MGCRTRVFANRHGENTSVGRGNLSFTTVNLVRIAIEAAREAQSNLRVNFDLGKGSEEFMTEKYNKEVKKIFLNKLEQYTDVAARQLYDRYKFQCTAVAKQFPLLMSGLWQDSERLHPSDRVEEVLKHGTLSIGFIGLAETLKALTGKHHGEDADSQKLGLKIIKFMRDKCDEYAKEHNLNFTLLATPAEGLSGRFVNIDRAIYGKIKGVTDREYYTNSFHVPVHYNISIANKIKLEGPYHALTNAGHISYIELDGNVAQNIDAFEKIVRLMKENNFGYGAINHPVDRDPICGYVGVIKDVCPKCGRHAGEGVSVERLKELGGK